MRLKHAKEVSLYLHVCTYVTSPLGRELRKHGTFIRNTSYDFYAVNIPCTCTYVCTSQYTMYIHVYLCIRTYVHTYVCTYNIVHTYVRTYCILHATYYTMSVCPCVDGGQMAALGGTQPEGQGGRGGEKEKGGRRQEEEDGEERENLQNFAVQRRRYVHTYIRTVNSHLSTTALSTTIPSTKNTIIHNH